MTSRTSSPAADSPRRNALAEKSAAVEKELRALLATRPDLRPVRHKVVRPVWAIAVPAPREEWRAVPGFEGFYEVSDLGRVRSFHFGAARPKKPRPNGDGYPVLVLYGGGKRKTIPLHRLVAEVFHAAKRNVLHNEVAHLDGDRANARADNLKWVSKVENHFHMKVHGTATVGERHPRAKLTAAMVRQIRSAPEPFNCAAAGRAFGVNVMTVFRARKGQSWRSI